MRLLCKAVAIGVALMGPGAAHAALIDTYFTNGMNTTVAGATVFDFDSGLKPAGYSGDASILAGSISGQAAAPAGDATPYLSVAYPASSGSETFVSLGSAFNYFGLYWGSMDAYNSLQFYSGALLVASLTGSDVILAGTQLGDQTAAGSNRYVNFNFLDATFDRIVFGTTQFAFESDNHAFARVAVAEPATLTLMGLALFGLALLQRRRRMSLGNG